MTYFWTACDDKHACHRWQLVCGLTLLLGTLAIPFSQPLPWLTTIIMFLWGAAIGGMHTLAVIRAGERVGEHQVSTAMTAIVMSYTLGGVWGPIVTRSQGLGLRSRGMQ